ncbi:MAG TPA: SusC/RagA family TonB-linked outer membrane protein [Longimicrobiales bacterium]|nr:SusC/RagA family TonB-linked outer membrane protein [Longimicrobiales bacterium]
MCKHGKVRLSGVASFILLILLSVVTVAPVNAQDARGTILGRVIEEGTGTAVAGASIVVAGTQIGTMSDASGSFVIEGVPVGRHQVEVGFLGYATYRTEVTVSADQPARIEAVLRVDALRLEQIVATGYGTSRKEALTGSVLSVSADELKQLPTASLQTALQGTPGIVVTSADGTPGGGINVRVRGVGSITAGSEPLYVVDGIPLFNDAAGLDLTGFANSGRSANTLASLNPNDVESIVVLKDAASTAIYGSRGANGVVLITTKGGVAGNSIQAARPQFEFNYLTGFSSLAFTNLHQGLNASDYHDFYIESRMNAGMSREAAETQFENAFPVREDNNWLDLITQRGTTQQFDLSARGSTENLTYFVSGGAFLQDGVVISTDFDRYSGRSNLTARISDRFRLANNLSLSHTSQNAHQDGTAFRAPFYQVVFMPSVIPMYDEDGEWYARHTNIMGAYHPVGGLKEDVWQRETTRVIENLTGTFTFDDRFSLSSAWGFDLYSVSDYEYQNPRFGDSRNLGGGFDEGRANVLAWQGTNTLSFADVFSDAHHVDAVVGVEASKTSRNRVRASGSGFAHPSLKTGASAALTQGSSDRLAYSFASMFARANYDYDGTYLVSASVRRDGSSKFGPDMRYGNFWSLGLGYTLTNSILADNSFVDYLKLRGSYGEIGNADIGSYEWQGLYSFAPTYYNLPGSGPSQVENRNLTWESQAAFNVGIDYAVLDNRFSGALEWYRKVSSDLLLNVPVSYTTGFRNMLQNYGDMENWGWEFSVQASVLRRQSFDLGANFNITSQNNEITKLGDAYVDGAFRREEGRDYQEYFLYPWAGVDPATGDPLYYTDETKTATTSLLNETDRIYDGKTATPKYIGSFGLSASAGPVTVQTNAIYAFGHHIYEYAARYYNGDGAFLPRSTSQWAWENRWQQPGDNAKVPRQVWGGSANNNPNYNARYLFKGDYVRLKDVSLSYRIPDSLAGRVGMQSLSLDAKLTNFLTWVGDSDLHIDPEQPFDGVYETTSPNMKTISIGFRSVF